MYGPATLRRLVATSIKFTAPFWFLAVINTLQMLMRHCGSKPMFCRHLRVFFVCVLASEVPCVRDCRSDLTQGTAEQHRNGQWCSTKGKKRKNKNKTKEKEHVVRRSALSERNGGVKVE
ncbi:hypothetical protein TRVL_10186 [Trypanosoma vivax]|nr:hypothetical protein TRVL_10186 [Trypanosoma vivax]